MATTENLYITHVEKEGPHLKVWGQLDRNIPVGIEKALRQMTASFEQGQFLPSTEEIINGRMIFAKFNDGLYYRAKVTNAAYLVGGVVEVQFVDYGNRELIQYENTRSVPPTSSNLGTIPPQAKEFILANLTHRGLVWEDSIFEMISSYLRYDEFKFQIEYKVCFYM